MCHLGEIGEIIARHQPTGTGMRESCLWRLGRDLKAVMPNADQTTRRQWVTEWWERGAGRIVRTRCLPTAITAFERAWARIEKPSGATWASAIAMASACPPLESIPSNLLKETRIAQLGSLLAALNQIHRGCPFPLPCRKVAEHLDCGFKTASRDITIMVHVGVLRVIEARFEVGKRARIYQVVPSVGAEPPSHIADRGDL
jgi:hypothetical protein